MQFSLLRICCVVPLTSHALHVVACRLVEVAVVVAGHCNIWWAVTKCIKHHGVIQPLRVCHPAKLRPLTEIVS